MHGEEGSSSFKVGVGSSLRVEYTFTLEPVVEYQVWFSVKTWHYQKPTVRWKTNPDHFISVLPLVHGYHYGDAQIHCFSASGIRTRSKGVIEIFFPQIPTEAAGFFSFGFIPC